MDLTDVLRAVRRGWWWLLGSVLLGLGTAATLTAVATPRYAETVHLYVASADRPVAVPDASTTDGLDEEEADAVYEAALYSRQRAGSYATALESEQLAALAVDRLGLDVPASRVAEGVRATVEPGTVVVELTVTDTSASRAREVAQALVQAAASWVDSTEDPVGLAHVRTELVPLTGSAAGPRQVSPDLELGLGLGGALGLLLGLALAVRRDRSRAVATESDVALPVGAPPAADERRETRDAERAAAAALLSNLALGDAAGLPVRVVVTGTARDDGIATVVRELTDALAADGRRVAVVVADPRPDAGTVPPEGAGLGELLAGTATLPEVVRQRAGGQVAVVPPGNLPADDGVLPAGPAMRAVLDELAGAYDHVLVQAPPVPGSAAAPPLLAGGDGGLLVARYRGARRGRLVGAADAVRAAGVPLLGVVLTAVPPEARVVAAAHSYGADADRGAVVARRRAVLEAGDGRGSRV